MQDIKEEINESKIRSNQSICNNQILTETTPIQQKNRSKFNDDSSQFKIELSDNVQLNNNQLLNDDYNGNENNNNRQSADIDIDVIFNAIQNSSGEARDKLNSKEVQLVNLFESLKNQVKSNVKSE